MGRPTPPDKAQGCDSHSPPQLAPSWSPGLFLGICGWVWDQCAEQAQVKLSVSPRGGPAALVDGRCSAQGPAHGEHPP